MAKLLEGKVAIVTGSGRGIGQGEALALAAAGAKVVVNDLGGTMMGDDPSKGPAEETVAQIRKAGGEAVANADSVADFAAAKHIIQQALDTYGRLDILVNNAGNVRPGGIEDYSEDDFDRIVDVHLKGAFNTCKHAVPIMKKQRYGRIINTASNQWRLPSGQIGYAAAKGGVVSLTWALAWELEKHGVTANAIAPFALTRMTTDLDDRNKKMIAAGQMSAARAAVHEARADATLVAPMVVYLASDLAKEVNGIVFRVGGDKIARFSHPEEQVAIFHDINEGPWDLKQLEKILPSTLFARGSKAPHI